MSDDPEQEPQKSNFAPDTVLEPGQYLVVTLTDDFPGFKLGKEESLGIFTPDGQLSAQTSWEETTNTAELTRARVPDITGEWRWVAQATPGAPNQDLVPLDPCQSCDASQQCVDEQCQDPPVIPGELVINEVAAAGDPDDWVEL